jgi:integrase
MTMRGRTEPTRRARKRADGEGSLSFDAAKKLWVGSLMVGYKPDGKPDRRKVKAKSQSECRRKLDRLKARAETGQLGDSAAGRETTGAFLERWLESIDGTMERKSFLRHQGNVRRHLIPILGKRKLADLRPEHIISVLAALRSERPAPARTMPPKKHARTNLPDVLAPLSPRSVKYVFTTIRLALDTAVEWGSLPRNVARAIKAPKVPRVEILAMKPDEVAQFLTHLDQTNDARASLYIVAVLTGCRLGELLGLKWADLDLDAGTITIQRTLVAVKGGRPQFSDPKTPRSRRSFTISADAREALRVQRDRQLSEKQSLGEAYQDFSLVFARPIGTPLDSGSEGQRFGRAVVAAGLGDGYTFHSLRHSAATMMLAAGISAKIVADRLGHSTAAFTLDRYSHALKSLDVDAADTLQAVLDRARTRVVERRLSPQHAMRPSCKIAGGPCLSGSGWCPRRDSNPQPSA